MSVPKRRFPHIQPRLSGGEWKWRARIRTDSGVQLGKLQPSQEAAYADAERLRGKPPEPNAETLTPALERVRSDAKRRGVSPGWIRSMRAHHTHLIAFFGDCPVESITGDRIEAYVTESLAAGRSPNTVTGKALPQLAQAFASVGLEMPKAGNRPRKAPPPKRMIQWAELIEIIDRIRAYPCAPNQVTAESRERHADILELVARTGVRPHELARVRLVEVDLAGGLIPITRPKVKGQPRELVITPKLKPIVQRMVLAATGETLVPSAHYVTRMAQRWGKRLGVDGLNARALRHSAANAVQDRTGSLRKTMAFLGHRSVTTTAHYLHADDGERGEIARVLD